MSFKIIQEHKKKDFIIIPTNFEKNGVFWYPPALWSTKRRNGVLKNKDFLPNKATWEARQCIVKKRKILTYEMAEEQEELLIEARSKHGDVIDLKSDWSSDEDDSADVLFQSIPLPMPKIRPEVVSEADNALWNCFNTTSSSSNFRSKVQNLQNRATIASPTVDIPIPAAAGAAGASGAAGAAAGAAAAAAAAATQSKTEPKNSEGESDNVGGSLPKESTEMLLNSIKKCIQDQQKDTQQKFADMRNYISTIFSQISHDLDTLAQIQYTNSLSGVYPDNYPRVFCYENYHKVGTLREANILEKTLMVYEFRTDMIDKFNKMIGGFNGRRIGDGVNCCYDLAELIFQRKFLKICSWDGVSPCPMHDSKIAFFKFRNIICLFAHVVIKSDPLFKYEDTQKFFKEILWNSKFLNQPVRQNIFVPLPIPLPIPVPVQNVPNQPRAPVKRKQQPEATTERVVRIKEEETTERVVRIKEEETTERVVRPKNTYSGPAANRRVDLSNDDTVDVLDLVGSKVAVEID
ncbi:uncharacterized protein LOC129912153 [Episyrphus balteatus]|uniref:uncharacterized protein LOC129912153 n=1 Tax=Episyrphus balteatus TaxID=286459 RepID=UPI0024859564|nr:uncharacterized protein LOC129912153 [Episyrphus balteatus]